MDKDERAAIIKSALDRLADAHPYPSDPAGDLANMIRRISVESAIAVLDEYDRLKSAK